MRKRQRGNALIETALAFTILCPLFYGTFQFGLGFLYYNELTNAVRAGARLAANRTYTSSTPTPTDAFRYDVLNTVVYGNPDGGTTPVVRGLSLSNVSLAVGFASGVPRSVTVSITNYPMALLFQTIRLNKPVVSFPFIGHYAPPVT